MKANPAGWASAIICCALAVLGGIDPMTQNALKVMHILRTIERHQPRSGSGQLTAEVSQPELNDYIVYRLKKEKQPLIRKLSIKLFDDNQVRGNVHLDANQLKLGLLFGQTLDFDLSGILQTRNGAGRIDLRTAKLHGRPVKPQVLDMVLKAVSLYYGTDPVRLDDWHELPKGIKQIQTRKGKAVLFY